MSKKEKLIRRLKSKPRDFTVDEADTLFRSLGMKKSNKGKTSGSRVEYINGNDSIKLHTPHPRKEIPIYQLHEIVVKLERMGLI